MCAGTSAPLRFRFYMLSKWSKVIRQLRSRNCSESSVRSVNLVTVSATLRFTVRYSVNMALSLYSYSGAKFRIFKVAEEINRIFVTFQNKFSFNSILTGILKTRSDRGGAGIRPPLSELKQILCEQVQSYDKSSCKISSLLVRN